MLSISAASPTRSHRNSSSLRTLCIDGTTFNFNATYQRQRPGLLLANGNIYAGFGSFCDFAANLSRGWLLGWSTGSLTPLPANQVFDIQATSPDSFFLSSIWMSGYGPATDDSGNILFVTGNSDYSGTTYDGVSNIQESVVKVSSELTTMLDLFTPESGISSTNRRRLRFWGSYSSCPIKLDPLHIWPSPSAKSEASFS